MGVRSAKPKSFREELFYNRSLYLLALPGILFFTVFNYLPMAGLYIAFVRYTPIAPFFGLGSPFVGFKNFEFFFTSRNWLIVTANTMFLNALFIFTGLLTQIILAVSLNEMTWKQGKKVSQALMFLPNFISWTVVSVFSIAFFSTNEGIINKVILFFGGRTVNFYQTPGVWPFLLVMLRLWKGAGFGTVIYLSTIAGIDEEMYEAALLDGAGRLKRIWYITLPMLRTNNDIGMSSAVGLFQSVLGFITVVIANWLVKRIDKDSALF
jgi:putative aldouronate transport system permease protein